MQDICPCFRTNIIRTSWHGLVAWKNLILLGFLWTDCGFEWSQALGHCYSSMGSPRVGSWIATGVDCEHGRGLKLKLNNRFLQIALQLRAIAQLAEHLPVRLCRHQHGPKVRFQMAGSLREDDESPMSSHHVNWLGKVRQFKSCLACLIMDHC